MAPDAEDTVVFVIIIIIFFDEYFGDRWFNVQKKCEAHADQHQEEPVMVPDANAIIDPWAVMIPPFDTPIANIAMVGTGRRQHLIPRANIVRMEILQ